MNSCAVLAFLQELREGTGYNCNRVLELFRRVDTCKLIRIAEHISENEESNVIGQFVYYLTLFREEYFIKNLIQDEELPLDIIEYLIYSSYTQASYQLGDCIISLDKLLTCFSQKTYLRLLLDSDMIKEDGLLRYYIAGKMDRKRIDDFFNSVTNLHEYLAGLALLPDEVRTNIFMQNMEFYGYVSLFVQTFDFEEKNRMLMDFDQDASNIQDVKHTIVSIFDNYDVEHEKTLELCNRNSDRFAQIVHELHKNPNTAHVLNAMYNEGAIIDKFEESLISEILHNPFFKNVRSKYIYHGGLIAKKKNDANFSA